MKAPPSPSQGCFNCRLRGPVENVIAQSGEVIRRVFCYGQGCWKQLSGWCPEWPAQNVVEVRRA